MIHKIVLLFLFLCSPLLQAQSAELIEEFFTTENAYPHEKDELEVETTFHRAHSGEEVENVRSVLGTYGLTNRLQVEAGFEWVSSPGDVENLHNLDLGLFYSLVRDTEGHIALNAGVGVSLPTNHDDLDKETQLETFLVAGRQLGKGQIHATLNPSFGSQNSLNLGAGLVYPWKSFRGLFEISGATADSQLSLTPGFYWHPGGAFEAGVALERGLTSKTPDWTVIVKITMEIGFH